MSAGAGELSFPEVEGGKRFRTKILAVPGASYGNHWPGQRRRNERTVSAASAAAAAVADAATATAVAMRDLSEL